MASEYIPTVGVFPTQIPRNPTEINTFLEHMLLGQILEPLVSSDKAGNISPGIASSWKVTDGGKTIEFIIKSNVKFSNGMTLNATDVVVSIKRHIDSEKSQSKSYLTGVKKIEAMSERVLKIELDQTRTAIFKILSREHLGIMPADWKMAENEPYVGTGPYRLIKRKTEWFLIRNENYQGFPKNGVSEWKLVLGPPNDITLLSKVEYAPIVLENFIQQVKDENKKTSRAYQDQALLSFIQSSIWVTPFGRYYKDQKMRKVVAALAELLILRRQKLSSQDRAVSIIPKGVSGYFSEYVGINNAEQILSANKSLIRDVIISTPETVMPELIDKNALEEINNRYAINVVIKHHKLEDGIVGVKRNNPDLVIAKWAGGFNDPEGFIGIVPTFVGSSFEEYIGEEAKKMYLDAQQEQDWSVRSHKFQKLAKCIITENLMVPGFRTKAFSIVGPSLKLEDISFRYSPRLTDVRK